MRQRGMTDRQADRHTICPPYDDIYLCQEVLRSVVFVCLLVCLFVRLFVGVFASVFVL